MNIHSALGGDGDEETTAAAGLSADELIRKATADRAAGREGTSEIEALLLVAADQNQAALDRLAK